MAGAAGEVDALAEGRSALWQAVHSGRYDNAQILAAAAYGYVGLRPPNARPVAGPPHAWVLLPERDYGHYWHDSVRS